MSETERWAWGLAATVLLSLISAVYVLTRKWIEDRENARQAADEGRAKAEQNRDEQLRLQIAEFKDALSALGIMLKTEYVTKDDLARETRAQTAELKLWFMRGGSRGSMTAVPRPHEDPPSDPPEAPPSRARLPSRPR